MNLFASLSRASRAGNAEEAVSRLLQGIEAGDAVGRSAEAYKAALKRHGAVILDADGPEGLAAAIDRLCDVPGRGNDRRAVLDRLWSNLGGMTE